jgi:hypothetical protein
MSSFSLSNFSLQPQNRALGDRLVAPQAKLLPQVESAQRTGEFTSTESAQAAVSAVPSSMDMRFEFNAVTKAWMLTMTDSGSGDVVRKIALAAFSQSNSAAPHRSAIWIDKAV